MDCALPFNNFCLIYLESDVFGENLFFILHAPTFRPFSGDGVSEAPLGPKSGPKNRPGYRRVAETPNSLRPGSRDTF